VTAFVLRYRLGSKYLYPIPLQDAQRAIRFVRSQANEFGIGPDRIGFMGFSAGGHLAAMTATMFDGGKPGLSFNHSAKGSGPHWTFRIQLAAERKERFGGPKAG
jgi:dienelactone hydrolase